MSISISYITPPHYHNRLLASEEHLPDFGDVVPDLDSVVTGLGKVIKDTRNVVKIGSVIPTGDVVPDLEDILEKDLQVSSKTSIMYAQAYTYASA